MPKHLTLAELNAGLLEILAAPADNGILRAIVIRPSSGQRRDLQTCPPPIRRSALASRRGSSSSVAMPSRSRSIRIRPLVT